VLLAVALAQLADLATFAAGLAVLPLAAEQNPVARWLGTYAGLGAVIVAKAIVIAALVGGLEAVRRGYPRAVLWGCAFIGAGTGIVGASANLASLIAYLRG